MSPTKILSLTAEQEAALPAWRDEWLRVGISTEPADRPRAETAFAQMYRELGREPVPVQWVDGPATACLLQAALKSASLWDSLGNSLWASLSASLRNSLRASLGASLGDLLGNSLWDSLRDSLRNSLRDSLWASLRASLRDSLWASLRASLRDSWWGQHELYWVAYYTYPRDVLGVPYAERDSRVLDLWADVGRSCGWWWAFEDRIIACERPAVQALDEQGRLHREDGPAILCRDGFAVYGWHGVRVPERVIMQPESLSADDVLAEPNAEVSRVMLERMGIERFMASAQAEVLDRDTVMVSTPLAMEYRGEPMVLETAEYQRELLRVRRREGDGNPNPIVAVRVTCPSTGHGYLLRVPPETVTCQEAVAWTFGMSASEYRPLVEA
jgi:hypothetical protein